MPEIVDDYNFVRLGGRTFTITEVNIPTLDRMVEEIKATNTERVAALTAQLRTDFVSQANTLASLEHERILRAANGASITVPNNLACAPLVVIRGTLCPVRSVLYKPERVYGSINGWLATIGQEDPFWQMVNDNVTTTRGTPTDVLQEAQNRTTEFRLSITGTPHIDHTCATLYALWQDKIAMSRVLFHTLSELCSQNGIGWYHMCTGNSTGTQYWALPYSNFSHNVSTLNMDSLASRSVQINGASVSVSCLIQGMTNKVVRFLRPEERW